jgi:MFS family permease
MKIKAWINNFRHRTFSSLKIRNYRLYFIGQGISMAGTWMQTIGQSWLVLKITGSGTALGLVTALQFLPILIFGPIGGVLTDRFPKRKLLFFTQSVSGILALFLAILVSTNTVQLFHVYILALGLGITNAIDSPVRQSFVVEMVGESELHNAVTLNSTIVNLARVIGPAIAGIVIASLGMASCFYINATSFLAVLVCLYLMREHELMPSQMVATVKGQFAKGLDYIRKAPAIRDILIMMTILGIFSYEFQVSLALLAKYTFNGNANYYALLTSAMGVGSVFGGLLTAHRRSSSFSDIALAAILFGISMVLVALCATFNLAVIAMVIVGVFSIIFASLGNTTLQLNSVPEMRGRVMSFWTVAFFGTTPIGGPIIGWIGEKFSPGWSLAVGGIAALIAGFYGYVRYSATRTKNN